MGTVNGLTTVAAVAAMTSGLQPPSGTTREKELRPTHHSALSTPSKSTVDSRSAQSRATIFFPQKSQTLACEPRSEGKWRATSASGVRQFALG